MLNLKKERRQEMSDLQKLGRELDYFYGDVKELLPNYTDSIIYPLHKLFVQLIQTGTSLEDESILVGTLYKVIQDIQNEWRSILSETYN